MLKLKLKQIALLLGDVAVFYLSLYGALTIRYLSQPENEFWAKSTQAFLPILFIWLLVLYINGLYNLKNFANRFKFLELFLKSLAAATILSIAFFYIFPYQGISPKTSLLIFSIVFSALFLLIRYTIAHFLKNRLPKTNLGIIGYNKLLLEIIKEIKNNPHLGYEIKFILVDPQLERVDKENFKDIDILDPETGLEEAASRYKINTFILESGLEQSEGIRKRLFNCLPLGISYITLANFYEKITGRVPLEIINQNWFLENLNLGDKKFFEIVKRGYDVIISSLGLVLTAPFWPLVALGVKLSSHGPIFFKQIRLGKNNIPFTVIKFRTMTTKDNNLSYTIEGDRRITKFGLFLRKTRIDEVPQLINVLKGEISFIGPRPERPEFVAELNRAIPFYNIRMLIKPGLTGWDQISGEYHSPSAEDTFRKLQHDLFYIKNRSLYLDFTIVLKTIKTVLSYKGR